jgi:hypothetical protein
VTQLSVTPETAESACDRRPLQAARRQPPRLIRLDDIPTDGLIIDEAGNEITVPAPHELPPTDWQEVFMRGCRLGRRPAGTRQAGGMG